jgi:hypothetical protein
VSDNFSLFPPDAEWHFWEAFFVQTKIQRARVVYRNTAMIHVMTIPTTHWTQLAMKLPMNYEVTGMLNGIFGRLSLFSLTL